MINNQIECFRLLAIRNGLKLEIKGLKLSSGKSCATLAKEFLGLPKNTRNKSTLQIFEQFLIDNGVLNNADS